MSNQRIANQLIARMKCNGPTNLNILNPLLPSAPPPLKATSPFAFLQWMLGSQMEAQAPGICPALPAGKLATAGSWNAIQLIQACLLCQNTPILNQVVMQAACRWWQEQTPTGPYVSFVPPLAQFLTPHVPMTGWPDWLVTLAHLLALTRRTWVYTVVLTARNRSAGWPDRLRQVCSTDPRDRNALCRAVYELELLAYDLEGAGDAVRGGAPTGPVEQFLAPLAAGFPGPLSNAGRRDLAERVLEKWRRGGEDSHYPHLTAALNALHRCPPADLAPTLGELSEELTTFAGERVQLPSWRATDEKEGLRGERNQAEVFGELRTLPRPAAANPESVLEVKELADLVLDRLDRDDPAFNANDPRNAVLTGLLAGDSWDAIVSRVRPWMLPPGQLDEDRLEAARDRLTAWRNRVAALGRMPPPASPPAGRVDVNYWLLLEIPPSLWVNPPTALNAAIACVTRWRADPAARPAAWWPGLGPPEEEPLRAALASLYLDEVVRCLIACYLARRRDP